MSSVPRIIIRSLIAALLPVGAWAGPVNINTADAKTLARELDGIGPAKAQAIVDYRQKNGSQPSYGREAVERYTSCMRRAMEAAICRGAKRVRKAINPFRRPATTSGLPRIIASNPIRATVVESITERRNNAVSSICARR